MLIVKLKSKFLLDEVEIVNALDDRPIASNRVNIIQPLLQYTMSNQCVVITTEKKCML